MFWSYFLLSYVLCSRLWVSLVASIVVDELYVDLDIGRGGGVPFTSYQLATRLDADEMTRESKQPGTRRRRRQANRAIRVGLTLDLRAVDLNSTEGEIADALAGCRATYLRR